MAENGISPINRDAICTTAKSCTSKFKESNPSNLGWPDLSPKEWHDEYCWPLLIRSRRSGMNSITNLSKACWCALILEGPKYENSCGQRERPSRTFFQTGKKRMKQEKTITMPHATRTMPHFLVAVSLTIAVALTELPIQAHPRIRRLGNDSFGESLKEFQARYPKAKCMTDASAKTKPENSSNVERTGRVYCYFD